MKWVIELGEFEIESVLRVAIKGQALGDFVVEFTYPTKVVEPVYKAETTCKALRKTLGKPFDNSVVWQFYVDGSSYANESGAGLILISSGEEKINYALRLNFNASNNEA
ncbi:hypothetical protein TorRG33x02_339940 [Trema orientale]|uniref:RNase H type-1 domain-containing protein n=1 Tax=Trema orientale TaxID=63057 RepID=A0A2P5AW03_TREOI|nr:hypothetical protein TorRG33x02_339940 [Trema orientale]